MVKRIDSKEEFRKILTEVDSYYFVSKRTRHTMGSPWDGPYIRSYQDCINISPCKTKETINKLIDDYSSFVIVLVDDMLFLLREENQINIVANKAKEINHAINECNLRFYDI